MATLEESLTKKRIKIMQVSCKAFACAVANRTSFGQGVFRDNYFRKDYQKDQYLPFFLHSSQHTSRCIVD